MGVEQQIPLLAESNEKLIQENCGIIGVYSENRSAPLIVRKGLTTLQPRGREKAGICASDEYGDFRTHTGTGLIPAVLNDEVLENIGKSYTATGHNRYSTSKGTKGIPQPITIRTEQFGLSLGHNGNLFDLNWFSPEEIGFKFNGTTDSALLTAFLLNQRQKFSTWLETFQESLPIVQQSGTASLVMLTDDGSLWGVRDPSANRPLSLGILEDGDKGWILASETAALDTAGAHFVRELEGGEIVQINKEGNISFNYYGLPRVEAPCIFERIYFARPDTYMSGQRIRVGREKSGRALAKRMKGKGIKPTVVVPILESGYFAAKGVHLELNIPMQEASTTDHYIGRTFILPGQESRKLTVNGKHNFTPDGIVDEEAATVDDSGIRFNTSPAITSGLKEAGAKSVDLGFASPPVVNPCDTGIDMPTKEELPASRWEHLPLIQLEENVSAYVGSDTVTFLPIKDTAEAFGGHKEDFCYRCFGGPHPIRDANLKFRQKERLLSGKPKISIFISGGGTNLQRIIDGVGSGDIKADIKGVLSNNPEAFGLTRASQNGIETAVVSSKGMIKDPILRSQYDHQLITYVDTINPDIIVLAGWMVVLGDDFLKRMQEKEITVINLHPALLSRYGNTTVETSRGLIPVLRGTHAIQDAYNEGLRVSGVTVHQVLPGVGFDVGPIILKEEVRSFPGESMDEWEARIHQAEYRALPAALKRVIYVTNHNIDTSKGDFPW